MPAAGHLCQFVTIGDGSTEITLVKLNKGTGPGRQTTGEWADRAHRQATSKCNGVPAPCGTVLAPKHWPNMLKAARSVAARATVSGVGGRMAEWGMGQLAKRFRACHRVPSC